MKELSKIDKINNLAFDIMHNEMNPTEQFMYADKIYQLSLQPKLNKNQQIVLEWLKDELNDSYFKSVVSNLFFWVRYDNAEGFPNERIRKMVQAFEELDDKDFGQVLASVAEWRANQ